MRSLGWVSLVALFSSVQVCASSQSSVAGSTDDTRDLQRQVAALEEMVRTNQGLITSLQHRLSRLHQTAGDFGPLAEVMRLNAKGELVVTGVNMRIVGSPEEDLDSNGKGNLFLGYNAGGPGSVITGSHNIVLGPGHILGGSEGVVTGNGNTTLGSHAVILGSTDSIASEGGVIMGGTASSALAEGSVVLGGENCATTAPRAVVAGGIQNTASGVDSAAIGGARNETRGSGSALVGGTGHTSTAVYDTDG